jgi:hypothetical protein
MKPQPPVARTDFSSWLLIITLLVYVTFENMKYLARTGFEI